MSYKRQMRRRQEGPKAGTVTQLNMQAMNASDPEGRVVISMPIWFRLIIEKSLLHKQNFRKLQRHGNIEQEKGF
jgi:hypothetical protein